MIGVAEPYQSGLAAPDYEFKDENLVENRS